ncbi:uncharacterized protein LOC115977385 isoform X3 [Quercus lobata]|uniref:uncharacterized protein LOC115977385 isoform X3 n=1 Tax=Quercus lobata TaxID=97700 RepID=UPI001246DD1C|nr:uncharacterized protein LOC115977385 isoform X3 [Quercus lobata]
MASTTTTASSTLPLSKPDFPVLSSPRNKKLIVCRTHLQQYPTLRRISNLHRFNSNGFVAFSRLNDQIEENGLSTQDMVSNNDPGIEVQSRIWNWRGYSIRYQYSGNSGPALVLVHGFGANSDHWRKNIPVLAKSHRVYSIDLIGYGYSDKPNPRQFGDNLFYTFETWATQLNEFCIDVIKDEAFFICNSIGGNQKDHLLDLWLVGLQAAVMAPQICKGIILLNISLRMLHIKKQPWFGKPLIRSFQNLLRNTALGKYFYKSVATPDSVRGILCQCYHDTSQVTEELVQKILNPGLEPGAADVFLEFICYSAGPLPEELLPQVKDEAPHLVNPLVESFVARHATPSTSTSVSTTI